MELLAPYTVSVHAKTHTRNTRKEWIELDYEQIIGILKNAGYRGYLAIEYEHTNPPDKAIPRFAKKLLALRDTLR
ncbi:MAG: hypothetical protein C4336_07315 [Armatimonadota bacterium]